jgi:hypothetical protein
MKRIILALVLLAVLVHPVSGWGAQFVGIRAYDLNADSYIDDNGVYHNVDAPPLAGARAYICVKGECAWYTTGADGVAGLWLDWGTSFSVTATRPAGYPRCVPYSVVSWAGVVGQTAIMHEQVFTGACSANDANTAPVGGYWRLN